MLDLFDKYTPAKDCIPTVFEEDTGMFETYGQDLQTVMRIAATQANRVWTLVDADDGGTVWLNGYHYVNRIAYAITEEAGQPDESFVCVDGSEFDENGDLHENDLNIDDEEDKQ